MGRLEQKVVVVTGSTRGLGRAIAETFVREGARVVLVGRSESDAREAAAQLDPAGESTLGAGCDVSDLAQVRALASRAIERFGRIDVWINNAGLSAPYGPTAEIPAERFGRVLLTNVVGTFYGSHVALQHFVPARRGKLVNILGRGDTGVVPFQLAYSSSKWWLKAFTVGLAREHRDSGVGIFGYNPGLMSTDFLRHLEAIQGWEAKLEPLKTVARMWANPPTVPAEELVELVGAATDGRTGLVKNQLHAGQLVAGALREGLRRLSGRTGPDFPFDVKTVESTLRA
ncbi:MAG: SDR family oxidoreductase [Deltaproteobacteria bacterium]